MGRLRSFICSINSRNEAPRSCGVFAIRLAKYFCEEGLFCPSPQVASDRHQHECGPHERSGYPDGASERQQVQSHVDRMPHEPKGSAGRELMMSVDGRTETP